MCYTVYITIRKKEFRPMTVRKYALRTISVLLTVFLTLSVVLQSFTEEGDGSELSPTSKRSLLVNIDTNMILYSEKADEPFYCGFLPNVVTCMILLESEPDLEKTVTISEQVIEETKQLSAAKLKPGDVISLADLVKAALTSASQEACIAIAHFVNNKGTSSFIETMNTYVRELGVTQTSFGGVNSYYSSASKTTTISDLSVILQHALSLDGFTEFISTPVVTITVNGEKRTLYTYNSSIVPSSDYYISDITGLGVYASESGGYCSACVTTTKNMRVLAIASDTEGIVNIYNDLKQMVTFAKNEYVSTRLISKGDTVCEVGVRTGKDADFVVLTVTDDINALLPKSFDQSLIERVIDAPESIDAPVARNEKLGTLILRYNGQVYGTSDLVTKTAVEVDTMEKFTQAINSFFKGPVFISAIVIVAIAIAIYTIARIVGNNRRTKNRKSKERERVKIDMD